VLDDGDGEAGRRLGTASVLPKARWRYGLASITAGQPTQATQLPVVLSGGALHGERHIGPPVNGQSPDQGSGYKDSSFFRRYFRRMKWFPDRINRYSTHKVFSWMK
jgi:hypothetical protein